MLSLLLLVAGAWIAMSLLCGLLWVIIVLGVDVSRKRRPEKPIETAAPVHGYRPAG